MTTAQVSVCICTYRRPERLGILLASLAAQTRLPQEVVVVDNDAEGSACATVEHAAAQAPFPVHYDIQPVKNISLTRNRTIALASGEWLGLLDDDEQVIPEWLERLLTTQATHDADGVLGPVVCQVPDNAPGWIRAGAFYALPRFGTGEVAPLNRIGIGNALLRASLLRREMSDGQGPFDPAFGLSGGEDADLLFRLVNRHRARLIWCDEALATEPVEPNRLSLQWLMRRSLRGGQDNARHFLNGRLGPNGLAARASYFFRAAAQSSAALLLAGLTLVLGRHHAVHWLRKAYGNYGKLSLLWGSTYLEYK